MRNILPFLRAFSAPPTDEKHDRPRKLPAPCKRALNENECVDLLIRRHDAGELLHHPDDNFQPNPADRITFKARRTSDGHDLPALVVSDEFDDEIEILEAGWLKRELEKSIQFLANRQASRKSA